MNTAVKENYMDLNRYNSLVDEGKKLVGSIRSHQVKLAHLATQVCTIRHGGISNAFYTIKDFAKDIGINPKTLQDYVAIYRNVIKIVGISPEKCTPEQWRAASKVRRTVELKGSVVRREVGLEHRKMGVVKSSPEEIKKSFHKHLSGELDVNHKLYNWNSELLYIATSLPKMDLNTADKSVLREMLTNTMYLREFLSNTLSK